jgi:trehalose 6-phosphate synthase/phosphatase
MVLMKKLEETELIDKYRKAKCKLVLLDYDGTLVNYELIPDEAKLPVQLSDILKKLIDNPRNKVFIISGRSHQDIDKLLDHLPVDIIAEHGAMQKVGGVWKNQINGNAVWKIAVIPILDQITGACPGSSVEEKTYALTWHYRKAESQSGYKKSRELIARLEEVIQPYNLKILDGNKVVEILNNGTGKGYAVKELIEQNRYDFVLSIGDDATDEEMFELLLNHSGAYTIKVGSGDTFARYKLENITNVLSLLNQLAG